MRKSYLISVLFFVFLSVSVIGQNEPLSKLMDSYQTEKNDSIKLIKVQKAFSHIDKFKIKPESEYIAVLEQLYLSQYDNYQDENAVKNAEKLFNFLKSKKNSKYNLQLSKTAFFINTTSDYLQNYSKAIAYNNEQNILEKIIYGEKSEEVAKGYLQASIYYSRIDNVSEQIKSLDYAREILENISVKDKQLIFNMYQYYVVTLIYYGDIPKAKTYLDKLNIIFDGNKNNDIFMNNGLSENHTIPSNLFNYVLANVMYHKLAVSEERALKRTVDFFENYLKTHANKLTNNDLDAINDFYCELGIYYTSLKKDYVNAEESYDKALIYNKNYDSGKIKLFYHKGWTDFQFKKHEQAAVNFEKCIKINGLEKFIELISLYKYYGITLFHLNKNEKSEYYLKKVEDFYKDNATYQGFMSLSNLSDVGELYVSMYKKSKDKVILKRAIICFKRASNLFAKIYQGDSFNNNLNTRVEIINKGLIFCAMELGEKKGEVFELVEKNKSDFLWASFLKNHQLKVFDEPKKRLKALNFLKEQKQLLAIKQKDAKSNLKQISAEMAVLDKKINEIQTELKSKHSSFYNFTESSNSLENVQNRLTSNEVLLNFNVFDSIIYAFKVTNKDVDLFEITKNLPNLKETSTAYLHNLKSINLNVNEQSKTLYNILLKPFQLNNKEKLIIVSNSFLCYLPFETLKKEKDYVVTDHVISYANSIKLWQTQSLLPKAKNQNLVAFSPKYNLKRVEKTDLDIDMLTREGNYELIGAKAEAKLISDLFKGTYFDSEKATKKNFINNSNQFQIFHLAMHSIMNEEDENKSNLIFSNNEKLYFNDIYNLKIPAELVVLSACNTGNGNFKDGEGIMSLSRALTYSGVKSSVYSLWQVPDKETAEIMISFYENLKKGQAKDEALANAKTSYIEKNPMKKHPFYWAGFVVNGDVSPILTNNNWLIYIGIGLGVLILLFVFRKKLF